MLDSEREGLWNLGSCILDTKYRIQGCFQLDFQSFLSLPLIEVPGSLYESLSGGIVVKIEGLKVNRVK